MNQNQKYYRLRMQALQWWVFALNDKLEYLDDQHHGPYETFKEASDKANLLQSEGILDLDKQDDIPRGSQLK